MKIFIVFLNLVITTIFTQVYASETCVGLLNPQAHVQIIKTAKEISSKYQTEEMEELLMDTAHKRISPDIFDSKDIGALQETLNTFGLTLLLSRAISYPYDAEHARRQGREYPMDEDFALLPEGLIPTPPTESELKDLPDQILMMSDAHGIIETNQFFWSQIEKQFMIPVKLMGVLERMRLVKKHLGTLEFHKQSAGFFTGGGSLDAAKTHWTFNTLIRAKLVRELVKRQSASGNLNWSSFSSLKSDQAIVLAAAYPELIALLDLFPEMYWSLAGWQMDWSDAGVSTASKKIKGLSDHIAEFYISKDLEFKEVVTDKEDSLGKNVLRFLSPGSTKSSKVFNEAEMVEIRISPVTIDDDLTPTMSDDDERQSLWTVTAAWRAFARTNKIDFEAVTVKMGTNPFDIEDNTESINISINQKHPKQVSIRQLALFYLELTDGSSPVSFRGDEWID